MSESHFEEVSAEGADFKYRVKARKDMKYHSHPVICCSAKNPSEVKLYPSLFSVEGKLREGWVIRISRSVEDGGIVAFFIIDNDEVVIQSKEKTIGTSRKIWSSRGNDIGPKIVPKATIHLPRGST